LDGNLVARIEKIEEQLKKLTELMTRKSGK
jgi:hypothetical protein